MAFYHRYKLTNRLWKRIVLGIIVLFVVARIALPYVALHYINKNLATLPDYRGHLDDLDIHLWRGAYSCQGFTLVKINNTVEQPFFEFATCDIQIEWAPIWQGHLVTTVAFERPIVNFVFFPDSGASQTNVGKTLAQLLRDQIPFSINSLKINEGEIHYIDHRRDQPIDLFMKNVSANALNLTNQTDSAGILPASCEINATSIGGGLLHATLRFDLLQEIMPVDLNFTMKNINLPALNVFFKQYAFFTVEEGSLTVVCEMAVANNRISGYLKPFIAGIDVTNREERLPIHLKLYESALDVVGWLLENRDQETIATRVEIEGTVEELGVGIFPAIMASIRHAFFQKLLPQFDLTIDIDNVIVGRPGTPYVRETPTGPERRETRRERRQARRESGE